ncbi:protein NPGR1 isoform X1 [Asparagus officinalis]|uniref:protein NPGR1 isoform X1 n=1 Tax=Asparagus officinalis TaxID=4686 RepID=UPI00098E29B8|nr:protein NPGR1 isoform X1 [Asparagus officinalis]XP_020241347.1 protein NPGR1 isoform X1 [Asparagus officinalis]XP_020241348.1 protein NPGR1 isoform X1 [Asparagus officinalis]XP_020241349.1 protein NPGR1 isoform X1 [Asparagus officinalis]
MLCACSREQQLHFEEAPQSPESLATRDFSVSGLSSRTGGTKFDDHQVDDIESTLRETLSLNYEEARALLGRLEYQRGNFDAALQVFQGIDIRGLKPRMIKAISERSRPRKARSKGGKLLVNVMSMHSVSLLLEAILLKSKSLEELGHVQDAAIECKSILDIVESALPHGMSQTVTDDCKLKEIFHKALELHPELWKQAGHLDEAVSAYRRALIKPWNLNPKMCAKFQKDLAVVLLYGSEEVTLPPHLQQLQNQSSPKTNIEEAILLLLILMKKVLFQEISWDPEIMNHLTFALSLSGQFELLGNHVEQLLPGIYTRAERWYLLALCYSAAGMTDVALNILRNYSGRSERKHKPHIPALLLASKLCFKHAMLASEGVNFAERATQLASDQGKHFRGLSSHLLGVSYGNYARSVTYDSERLKLQKEALDALKNAAALEKDDPEVIYSLGLELAIQRELDAARECAVKYLELMGGISVKGWKLLALVVSSVQDHEGAELVVDLAITNTGIDDQLELLIMKAQLQIRQEQPKNAIETYRSLLTVIKAQEDDHTERANSKVKTHGSLEVEAWTNLASIYSKARLHKDSTSCLDIAKSIGYFSPKTWNAKGISLQAQSLDKEALAAFLTSLSIGPDYVPSMVTTGVALRKIGGKSLPIARSFLTNALKMEPTNHDAWLNLGFISKAEGSLREAADCFQEACELNESSPIMDFR